MRKYECIVVLHPGATSADGEAILGRFEQTVSDHGGEILQKDDWGSRKLAYPIDHQTNGVYHFYKFTADSTLVKDADRDFRLDDKVLRHMMVLDEEWAERNRAAQAKRGLDAAREEGDHGE